MNFKGPDSAGWFSLGLFVLAVMVLGLVALNPDHLRDNDLFKTIAQAVVLTGLINLAASFYFGASKKPSTPDPAISATSTTDSAGATTTTVATGAQS